MERKFIMDITFVTILIKYPNLKKINCSFISKHGSLIEKTLLD